jgi:hypothetical protein
LTTEPQRQEFTCVVCAEAATFTTSAECNWCDGRYHLNQRNDVEAKDCGAVWIDEQYLALQFACQNCLDDKRAASPSGIGLSRAAGDRRARASRPRRYKRRA